MRDGPNLTCRDPSDRILDIVKLAKPDFWRKKLTDSIVKCVCSATF